MSFDARGSASSSAHHAQHEAVIAELGSRALAGETEAALAAAAASALGSTLGADYLAVLRPSASADGLGVQAADGEPPGDAVTSAAGPATLIARALEHPTPISVENSESEEPFAEAGELAALGYQAALAARLPGVTGPPGALLALFRRPGPRPAADALLVQAVAHILAFAPAPGALAPGSDEEEGAGRPALRDSATGLPDRWLFEDRLGRALVSAHRHGRRLAVLSLDVDSFRLVNEGLGHAGGDELLRAFARRVGDCLRGEDTLARIGGDEFGVLLPELIREEDVLRVVERIRAALSEPLPVREREVITTASIGIALSHGESRLGDGQSLIRAAYLAMFAAKQRGPGGWEFYAEHMHHSAVRQLELTSELHGALARDELEVYFQPIVALSRDTIVSAEALVRWNHPRFGLLSPAVFLPLAEETGLIVALGRFVLRTACRALREWHERGRGAGELSISVNLGPQQLSAADLTADVEAALQETGIDPSRLVLEITENVLLSRPGMLERLEELRHLGVKLAVDDFGTGYAALSHLQRFPIDILKIDRSFLEGIDGDSDHARLVGGIIELAHTLGLTTVAEGIETRQQAKVLRGMGSELGQGYHFARPLPRRDIDALLSLPVADLGDLKLAVEFGP